jgi:predicted membrane protein
VRRNNSVSIPRNSFRDEEKKTSKFLWIIRTILETLTSFRAKRFATALPKLFLRHVWCRDVMMMSAGFTRAGIFLNIILLLILVNPLLAVRAQSQRKEKIRQQAQEERQTEFVKGKSKLRNFYVELRLKKRTHDFCLSRDD